MKYNLTYKPFGIQAILVEWTHRIDEKILKDIILFKDAIATAKKNKITDITIGYNSLTIKYNDELIDIYLETELLKCIYTKPFAKNKCDNFIWEIPVCYDEKFGVDLQDISAKTNLTVKEIIQLHHTKIYTVYFIGFLPGFLYLGGLDKKIFAERKPTPRLNVEKGSVAIGGSQTGVYPNNSAGGWNIIGKTSIQFFDVTKANPCFAKSGDKIKFKHIELQEFYEIQEQLNSDNYKIDKKQLDD